MKKILITTAIALFFIKAVLAQVPNPPTLFKQVYRPTSVEEIKVKVSGVKKWEDANNLPASDKIAVRTYYDGLNRVVQRIEFGKGTITKPDVITFNVYDKYANQKYEYLPYAFNTNRLYQATPVSAQSTFYVSGTGKYQNDSAPFSENITDNSPLNEITQAGSVGAAWQLSTGKIKTAIRRTNVAGDNVRLFNVDGSSSGYWTPGSLTVTETIDEEGGKTITFLDKEEKVLLIRNLLQTLPSVAYKETYTIYHFSGLPVAILPPMVTERLKTNSWVMTADDWNNNVHRYEYDYKGRPIRKKAPSAGWTNIVYDRLDRVALVQTAEQALSNKWNFYKYDKTDRLILDGVLQHATVNNRADMQTFCNNFDYLNTSAFSFESRGGAQMGYTDFTFPRASDFTSFVINNAYYYDSYDLDNNGTQDYAYANQGLGVDEPIPGSSQGKATVVQSKKLGTSDWLIKVYFYNKEGLLIQEQSNNVTNGAVADVHTNSYNFDETLKLSLKKKTVGSTVHQLKENMTYDNVGRLSSVINQFNATAAQTIAVYTYNELGQLVDKNLGQTSPGNYLQSVDLRYNIRGWLTGINNSGFTNDGYNEETNDVFGMEVFYNTVGDFTNSALFNGKISGIKWNVKKSGHKFDNKIRAYKYSYDKLGQLQNAIFDAKDSAWGYRADMYSEKGISYDLNGNILSLERNSMNSSGVLLLMDKLTYTYKTASGSDRLLTVNDQYGSTGSYGYKSTVSLADEYLYDEDGRLKEDKNRNYTYTYNEIGKVSRVTMSASRYIQYNYSAAGELLSKEVNDVVPVSTTFYMDNFVAQGNSLSSNLNYVSNTEGRILVSSPTSCTYEYFIKDHQGNVRVSFQNSGGIAAVTQENSYYAFGLIHNTMSIAGGYNRNLYNGGSEWQSDFANDPDLMNTPLRQYDPLLGRFNGVDPLADQLAHMTPFNFGFNDPVKFNDPTGAYPDMGYYDDNGYHPPYGWWVPQGAYRYESLEQWYQTPSTRWIREQYYNAGLGSFYEQFYGYGRRSTSEITVVVADNYVEGQSAVGPRIVFTPRTETVFFWAPVVTKDDKLSAKGTFLGIGGFAADATAEYAKGSFRLTNGNAGVISPRYYGTGWGGGSTARITTYSIKSVASKVSAGAGAISTGVAFYQIYKGDRQIKTAADATVGTIGVGTTIYGYITGASIPVVGEVVTAYGTARLLWDVFTGLGAAYGPSKWYGNDDTKYFK